MIESPIHRNKNTNIGLPEPSNGAKHKPNSADNTQTAIDVVLRPNFSAKIAETGIKAAKHKVAAS